MNSQPTKRCVKCGETKSLDDFYIAKDCTFGRRPECKRCCNDYHNKWARERYAPLVRGRYVTARDRALRGGMVR